MSGDKWYVSWDRLARTPSGQRSGMLPEKEENHLQQLSIFLQDIGKRLSLPLLCINTAILYTQRFYLFHPMAVFEPFAVASSALFLAAKVEEYPRKVETVAKLSRAMTCLKVDEADYIEQLLLNENVLITTLGFELQVVHPHQHVLKLCSKLLPKENEKVVAELGYFLATLSLHLTRICLVHKPLRVACMSVHLSSLLQEIEIPCSVAGKHWYQCEDPTLTKEAMEGLVNEFSEIMVRCPEKYKRGAIGAMKANPDSIVRKFLESLTKSWVAKVPFAQRIIELRESMKKWVATAQPTDWKTEEHSQSPNKHTHKPQLPVPASQPTAPKDLLNNQRKFSEDNHDPDKYARKLNHGVSKAPLAHPSNEPTVHSQNQGKLFESHQGPEVLGPKKVTHGQSPAKKTAEVVKARSTSDKPPWKLHRGTTKEPAPVLSQTTLGAECKVFDKHAHKTMHETLKQSSSAPSVGLKSSVPNLINDSKAGVNIPPKDPCQSTSLFDQMNVSKEKHSFHSRRNFNELQQSKSHHRHRQKPPIDHSSNLRKPYDWDSPSVVNQYRDHRRKSDLEFESPTKSREKHGGPRNQYNFVKPFVGNDSNHSGGLLKTSIPKIPTGGDSRSFLNRSATPDDVKTDKRKLENVPITASLGTEFSETKRFKPNSLE